MSRGFDIAPISHKLLIKIIVIVNFTCLSNPILIERQLQVAFASTDIVQSKSIKIYEFHHTGMRIEA